MDPLWATLREFLRACAEIAPAAGAGIGLVRYFYHRKSKADEERSKRMASHLDRFEGYIQRLERRADVFESHLKVFGERMDTFGIRSGALESALTRLEKYVKSLVGLYESELKSARGLVDEPMAGTGMSALKPKKKDR